MENKFRRIIYILLLFIFAVNNPVNAKDYPQAPISARLSETYIKPTSEIENIFKNNLHLGKSVVYTRVPRGLIVSIDSLIFFNEGDDKLLNSSKPALKIIAVILKELENECVIESNTNSDSYENSDYDTNWELSTVRAGRIAEYLIKEEKIPSEKIRAVGFGEMMPFYSHIEHSPDLDRRIDFVIINYENVLPLN